MSQFASGEVFTDVAPGKTMTSTRANNMINGATALNGLVLDQVEKTTVVDADTVLLGDSTLANSGIPKKTQIVNLQTSKQKMGVPAYGGTAGGTANAIIVATSPVSSGAYQTGETVRFKTGAAANTAAVTIAVDARGVVNLYQNGGITLAAGELPANTQVQATYNGTQFELNSPLQPVKVKGTCQQFDTAAAGSANAQTANPKDHLGNNTYAALLDGMVVRFKAGATNTGALTLAVNGLTAKSVVDQDGLALAAGAVKSGQWHEVIYDLAADKFILYGRGAGWQSITNNIAFGTTSVPGANARLLNAAHSLGATPTRMKLSMVCDTAELGFSIGDEVDVAIGVGNRPALMVNATNAVILQSSTTITLASNNGTLGTSSNITLANWHLKLYLGL